MPENKIMNNESEAAILDEFIFNILQFQPVCFEFINNYCNS